MELMYTAKNEEGISEDALSSQSVLLGQNIRLHSEQWQLFSLAFPKPLDYNSFLIFTEINVCHMDLHFVLHGTVSEVTLRLEFYCIFLQDLPPSLCNIQFLKMH